eukprot:4422159-Lingulodinium_polyedra.AAC.1
MLLGGGQGATCGTPSSSCRTRCCRRGEGGAAARASRRCPIQGLSISAGVSCPAWRSASRSS